MKKTKSLRLTRKSYRRKFVMFGVSVFMSLALTATGFAAWVLSNDATKNVTGEVEVGAVTEASIGISDIAFTKLDKNSEPVKNFVFEPLEDDDDGRVIYDSKNQPSPENLDLKIMWTISNYQMVGEHFVEFKIPENVYKAVTENYIALPKTAAGEEMFEVATSPITEDGVNYYVAKYVIPTVTAEGNDGKLVTYTDVITEDSVVNKVTFEMTLKFVWGTVFEGMNPGIYFDTEGNGLDAEYDEVKEILETFKATVHGMTYAEYSALDQGAKDNIDTTKPIPNYKVIVNAVVKK